MPNVIKLSVILLNCMSLLCLYVESHHAMLNVIMLNDMSLFCFYVESCHALMSVILMNVVCEVSLCWVLPVSCCSAEWHYIMYYYSKCHYAECNYAKCYCTEYLSTDIYGKKVSGFIMVSLVVTPKQHGAILSFNEGFTKNGPRQGKVQDHRHLKHWTIPPTIIKVTKPFSVSCFQNFQKKRKS